MHESKTEDVYEHFSTDKEMFDLTIVQLSQNKLVISKMRNKTCRVSIKKINGLKPKMYSF